MMIPAIISSLLGIAALSSSGLYGLGFVFLVPFFHFLDTERRFRKLLLGTLAFRLILLCGTVYYTVEPLNWITSILLFSCLAVVIRVFDAMFPRSRRVRPIVILISYCLFDIVEAKYSFLPTYLVTAGSVLGSSPFIGLAKYGGVVSLELFVLVSNALFLSAVRSVASSVRRRKASVGSRRPGTFGFGDAVSFVSSVAASFDRKKALFPLVGFTAVFLSAFVLSRYFLRQNSDLSASRGHHMSVTAVSVRDTSPYGLQKLSAGVAAVRTDLLVLPEELFVNPGNAPFTPEEASGIIGGLHAKASFIIGTFHLVRDGKNHNTALLFDGNGKIMGRYDKNRLVVLGEYWPYDWHPSIYDFLKDDPEMGNYAIFNPSNSYEAGVPEMMRLEKDGTDVPFGTLICLEAHYPDMIRAYGDLGARFIVNPVSNRWISSGTDLYDRLIGNLYAVESVQSGLPIVVSGVDGFAGVLFPDGTRATVDEGMTTRDMAY